MVHFFCIENFIDDRMQILSREVRIFVLADILDELHDFHRITVSLDPKAKLLMLLSYLFKRLREKIVHFFYSHVKFGAADMRVVTDEVCDLWPLDLHTIVMKIAALTALKVPLFTEYGRSFAPAIDTNTKYTKYVVFVWALEFVREYFLIHIYLQGK